MMADVLPSLELQYGSGLHDRFLFLSNDCDIVLAFCRGLNVFQFEVVVGRRTSLFLYLHNDIVLAFLHVVDLALITHIRYFVYLVVETVGNKGGSEMIDVFTRQAVGTHIDDEGDGVAIDTDIVVVDVDIIVF